MTAADNSPATATAAREAEALTAVTTPGNTAYKIGPQDVLDISVFKVPELSRSVQVADSGTREPAAGRRGPRRRPHRARARARPRHQARRKVPAVAPGHASTSKSTTASASPSTAPSRSRASTRSRGKNSLLQVVAMAEGLNADTASNEVVIFRQANGKRSAAQVRPRARSAPDPPTILRCRPAISSSPTRRSPRAPFQNVLKVLPVAGLFTLL